jgi:hypothetical protein
MSNFIKGLELGGSGPKRLTGTSPIIGSFYCIKARGIENLVINTLQINGQPTTEWNGAVITPGDYILFGSNVVTSITLASGEGDGYRV